MLNAFAKYSFESTADSPPNGLLPLVGAAERQGKEGGGASPQICFLHEEKEIVEFMNLMNRYGAMLKVRDRHCSVGIVYPMLLDEDNLKDRRRMAEILYIGEHLPELIDLLPDSEYRAADLAEMIKAMQ